MQSIEVLLFYLLKTYYDVFNNNNKKASSMSWCLTYGAVSTTALSGGRPQAVSCPGANKDTLQQPFSAAISLLCFW